ncbi:hypothetical protein TcBrA4_0138740 [Trypanosoma cruzi]|nr:hypothetical protein TcBrA4_0138740 [Trypanosoma cruzi]
MGRGPHHDGTRHWKDGRGIFRGRRGATRPYENVDGCGICCGDRSGDVADSSALGAMPLGHVTRYRRSAFDWRFAGRSHTTTECACTPRFSPSLELISFWWNAPSLAATTRVYRANRDVWEHVPRGQASVLIADHGGVRPTWWRHFRACGSSVSSTRRMVWSAGRLLWRLHLKQLTVTAAT